MKFFIAGIMQGSKVEQSIHGQNYREEIRRMILNRFPDAEVYDPFERNKDSLYYNDETGRETFLFHNKMCGTEVEVLIAYVPEASMGTAVEMWEAWKNGAIVLCISPMEKNWVIRFLTHAVYPDLSAFAASIENWSIKDGKLTGF